MESEFKQLNGVHDTAVYPRRRKDKHTSFAARSAIEADTCHPCCYKAHKDLPSKTSQDVRLFQACQAPIPLTALQADCPRPNWVKGSLMGLY